MLSPPNRSQRDREFFCRYRLSRFPNVSTLVILSCIFAITVGLTRALAAPPDAPLLGTSTLTDSTPLSDRILDGSKAFLIEQWSETAKDRQSKWRSAITDPARFAEHQEHVRSILTEVTGSHDSRTEAETPQWIRLLSERPEESSPQTQGSRTIHIRPLQWNVLPGLSARGLWVGIPDRERLGTVIIRPDASVTLHAIAGDTDPSAEPGVADSSIEETRNLASSLCSAGFDVVIVQPISRTSELRRNRVELTDQEYVYRLTNVLGRHPIGLEIQTIRSLVDWLARSEPDITNTTASNIETSDRSPIGLIGHGDGGLIAMLTAAIDTRVDVVMASGGWGNLENVWQQPIGRNVFDLLTHASDAEIAAMIAPRKVVIEASKCTGYEVNGRGAAPAKWNAPTLAEVKHARQQLRSLYAGDAAHVSFILPPEPESQDLLPLGSETARRQFQLLLADAKNTSSVGEPATQVDPSPTPTRSDRTLLEMPTTQLPWSAAEIRQWQLHQIERMTETWVADSREIRDQWINALDTTSIENYQIATIPHRERLERDVIGRFEIPRVPANARSRKWRETEKWTGFELEVDVFENIVAGGILLVPKDLKKEERRPLVVCVHGLEGRPEDTILNDHPAYHDFAARLCERGFIVFCPQQLYLGHDRFRVLQRLANPLGKTLFSIIIPQHRQFLSVLSDMPFVDRERIGFYGLSYGGKSAMRIPSVIEEYKAAICSADYNEWVLKNVSPRDGFSYVWTPEYEIFEFNLARTFNYAEMAAMICPRPFMVERGHFDGVGIDRWVAFEYAPVRYLYAAKLGIPERTEIEWFVGPHTIHGQGTFAFLHKHLQWPVE